MTQHDWLAEQFEAHRAHLFAVAYRMLGAAGEAEDAVQEAWIRLSGVDAEAVQNMRAWLTTVISRICLNQLQSRTSRREEPLPDYMLEALEPDSHEHTPEQSTLMADAVGSALLMVLDMLSPAERLAFVLHDVFAVSFEEIATILDRSPGATRQLASRARRRVQGQGSDDSAAADHERQRVIVVAFLAAAREGDFNGLLALLDPEAELRADAAAAQMGAVAIVRGAAAVAEFFAERRARAARAARIDGVPGAVFAPGGKPKVAFSFTFAHGKIAAIDLIADVGRLKAVEFDGRR